MSEGATRVALPNGHRRAAFTLSEVLITLGIIGVVAAMTLPVLVAKYQEKQWTTSYLRVYSLLENAYRMAQNDKGTYENWAGVTFTKNEQDGGTDPSKSDGMAVYENMIKPYIKINKSYFTFDGYDKTCMASKLYTLSKGDFNNHGFGLPIISLPSGECISLGDQYADFLVDLNGKKGPNTLVKMFL